MGYKGKKQQWGVTPEDVLNKLIYIFLILKSLKVHLINLMLFIYPENLSNARPVVSFSYPSENCMRNVGHISVICYILFCYKYNIVIPLFTIILMLVMKE